MIKGKAHEQGFQNKQAFWAHHIAESKKSALTQVGYCKEHNLSGKSFYYWKRKLLAAGETGPLRLVSLCQTDPLPQKMLEPVPIPIRIHIGVFSVEAVPGFDSKNLENVLRVLKGLSCGI